MPLLAAASNPADYPVGVVGAGTMGAGIAQVAAMAGHPVTLYDTDGDRVGAALDGIARALDRLTEKGRLSLADSAAATALVRPAATLGDLASSRLVVEAIVESLPVKRALFGELEQIVAPDAILATNTSSLSITDIAAGLAHPGRVIGMHFFNPAPVLPLVEVVSGAETDPGVADAVEALASAWGKTPVRATSTPGFIVNRVARPYYLEPFAAYEAGIAEPAAIDALLRGAGFRMGPFELTDLIGQDINAAVSTSVWEALGRDARFTPSRAQQELVAAGRLGRKTGAGWYSYAADSAGAQAPAAAPVPTPVTTTAAGTEVLVDGTAPGPLAALFERMTAGGVDVLSMPMDYLPEPRPATGFVLLEVGSVWLTRGVTATELARQLEEPVVLLDLADFATASSVGIAVSDGCPDDLRTQAIGVLGAAGFAVTELRDLPGLVVARTLAMLVNFAVDAVEQGVATADDVDLALVKGVNYPHGPLEWGDALGASYVVEVLDNLAHSNGPDAQRRYRVAPLLRASAKSGRSLR